MSVAIEPGKQPVYVGKTLTTSTVYIRPADSTQYTAGDVVADSTSDPHALEFIGAVRVPGGGGIIQSAILIDSTAEATKPDLELYLFNHRPAMQADNAAWAPTDREMEDCLGVISFPLSYFKTAGANGIIQPTNPSLGFACDANATSLYGVLVARNAYTPVSGEKFVIRLFVLQD